MAVIKLNRPVFEKKQKDAGLNDTELARAMGVNRSQVWRVKENKNDPGEEFIAGVLKAFPGATFDELFFLHEPLRDSHGNMNFKVKTG